MKESKSRGRQRSSESEEAILKATLELLKEKPLRDITIEGIARKAGVGKMTIYKWWPSKAYVALDAFRIMLEKAIPIPDEGCAEKDLEALLRSSMRLASTSIGKILGQFMAEAQADPVFAALLRERFLKPRREAIGELLDRAIKRGEIDRTVNREIVLDLIFGPLALRMMIGPVQSDADAVISTLMRGIGSKASKTSAQH
jgi:AcrR family transcriptional regulator